MNENDSMKNKDVYCYNQRWTVSWERNGFVGLSDGTNAIVITEQELREERIKHVLEKEEPYPFE